MTHDLRNALGVVMGNAQLLQESQPLTPKQQKYVVRILEASNEILAIVATMCIDDARQKTNN
jgi:signal transduction histidine kinase